MLEYFKNELGRVAETQYFLRSKLHKALESFKISEEGQEVVGDYDNYLNYWQEHFGDKFFDMATFLRLGVSVERCFKHFYMQKQNYQTIAELKKDQNYSNGIFQRVQSWQSKGVIKLYKDELGIDITKITNLSTIQELITHRHIYAHNSGLIDEKYLEDIESITGEDLTQIPEIGNKFPEEDVYWFRPLNHLNKYIEGARKFFKELSKM